MAPPNPLNCSSPDCDFTTPAGCPTWELMVTVLSQHTQSVHGGTQPTQIGPGNKLEKLPRPTFDLQMTESQWTFKKLQWDSYISQAQASDSVKLVMLNDA